MPGRPWEQRVFFCRRGSAHVPCALRLCAAATEEPRRGPGRNPQAGDEVHGSRERITRCTA